MSRNSSLAVIQEFLAQHRIALYGLAHDPAHFSHAVCQALLDAGHEPVPVNPGAAGQTLHGLPVHGSLAGLAPPVDAALVMTSAGHAAEAVRDALAAGVRRIWLYRAAGAGAVSDEALALCAEAGVQVVPGECPLMFLPDTSWPHRLHGWAQRIMGAAPT